MSIINLSLLFIILFILLGYLLLLFEVELENEKGLIYKKVKFVNLLLIKLLVDNKKETINFTNALDFIFRLVLLGLIFLLIPFKSQTIGQEILNKTLYQQQILIQYILILSLIPNFDIISKLSEKNPFKNSILALDKAIIVLLNLNILEKINVENTFLIKNYPGILLSFFLCAIIDVNKRDNFSKENLIILFTKKINQLIWIIFITFYFFNIDQITNTFNWFIVLGFTTVVILIVLAKILEKNLKMRMNNLIQGRILKVAVTVSLINYILLELHDFF